MPGGAPGGKGKKRPVLTPKQLKELENDDPLLRAERRLEETRPEDMLRFLDDRTDPNRPVDSLDISLDVKGKDSSKEEEESADGKEDGHWWSRTTAKVTKFQRKLATSSKGAA
uniref:Uncharacterized protein n=1 Tax=Odontella aurita TaxID=265563 RepID=A0A7S4I9C0_9STRA